MWTKIPYKSRHALFLAKRSKEHKIIRQETSHGMIECEAENYMSYCS